jgi:hypothetical protein
MSLDIKIENYNQKTCNSFLLTYANAVESLSIKYVERFTSRLKTISYLTKIREFKTSFKPTTILLAN